VSEVDSGEEYRSAGARRTDAPRQWMGVPRVASTSLLLT
jgi:hypothetical protein